MSHPDFFQVLYEALPPHQKQEHFCLSVHIIFNCDSEQFRIEYLKGNVLTFWEGEEWPEVLAECVQSMQSPF